MGPLQKMNVLMLTCIKEHLEHCPDDYWRFNLTAEAARSLLTTDHLNLLDIGLGSGPLFVPDPRIETMFGQPDRPRRHVGEAVLGAALARAP